MDAATLWSVVKDLSRYGDVVGGHEKKMQVDTTTLRWDNKKIGVSTVAVIRCKNLNGLQ